MQAPLRVDYWFDIRVMFCYVNRVKSHWLPNVGNCPRRTMRCFVIQSRKEKGYKEERHLITLIRNRTEWYCKIILPNSGGLPITNTGVIEISLLKDFQGVPMVLRVRFASCRPRNAKK